MSAPVNGGGCRHPRPKAAREPELTPDPNNPGAPAPSAASVAPGDTPEALARLLSHDGRASPDVVRRFLNHAPELGIDLDLLAATRHGPQHPHGGAINQVCLPVPGAGRTVMLFVSGAGPSTPAETAQRAAAVLEALRLTGQKHPAHLAQALIEPHEQWAADALEAAGLRRIAELRYLARPLRPAEARPTLLTDHAVTPPHAGATPSDAPWPAGIAVRPTTDTPADQAALRRALQASYAQTLDCPELAGMRTLDDIVDAHRAVGRFDNRLWWLVQHEGAAEGCLLLNRCPDLSSVELVYIGLSPAVRGMGLGRTLMQAAIAVAAGLERELRCAVDTRNTPALRMYERLGFRDAGRRTAYVGLVKDLPMRKS